MLPDLRPDLKDLRAIVTTRWKGNGYTNLPIYNIESYYIDTALDNDADTWNCEIGDPRGDLFELASRDSEVRIRLFGVGSEGSTAILTGIADDADYDQGVWTLTGRDFSSLATDSTVPPTHYRHVRAWAVVEQQAKALGFRNTRLAHGKMVKKIQFTDGSESYWDFWWRMYRKEQMWIWCEADGTLVANTLNYSNKNDYYLGEPLDNDPATVIRAHIPVIGEPTIHKTTQGRIGKVYVYWHRGDNGTRTIVEDPATKGWIKRPNKVMLDTDAHSANAAKKTGLEEIFEGKVGSVEFKVTIPDPGFVLRQNRIARLNIPSLGLFGQYFIVGVRAQAGADGFYQEVRLREKQYAVTRRIPTEPKAKSNKPGLGAASSLGAGIEGSVGNMPKGWGDYFAKAARAWCGPWDYSLFLATLIAICDRETKFQNIRQNGGPGGDGHEWYPYRNIQPTGAMAGTLVGDIGNAVVGALSESKQDWEQKFANQAGDGYITWEAGVGPMQLTSRGLKYEADDLLRTNYRNEYAGGRWHPQYNIMIGAKTLRSKLQATVGDTGRDIDMWAGVKAYNGSGPAADQYKQDVKNLVYNTPGYLNNIRAAIQEATAIANQPADGAGFAQAAGENQTSNTKADISSLTHIRKETPDVDLEHVDWPLLVGCNKACQMMNLMGTITSGYRSYDEQKKLWDRYVASGYNNAYIAARPGTSNHERGKAVDMTIAGRPAFFIVPEYVMTASGIHFPLGANDAVHITRIGVNG